MNPIEKLTELFEHFPGIGPRQARRFVQFLLAASPAVRGELSETVQQLGAHTMQCKKCYRWFVKEGEKGALCNICASLRRDVSTLFIVEKDADMENVERSGFNGLYFILGGTIPLAAEEPQKYIRVRELLKRIEEDAAGGPSNKLGVNKLKEVILGLSATTEGDHTRLILQEKLLPLSEGLAFTLSSLGRGLSTGSELEYADPDTIASALSSRG